MSDTQPLRYTVSPVRVAGPRASASVYQLNVLCKWDARACASPLHLRFHASKPAPFPPFPRPAQDGLIPAWRGQAASKLEEGTDCRCSNAVQRRPSPPSGTADSLVREGV